LTLTTRLIGLEATLATDARWAHTRNLVVLHRGEVVSALVGIAVRQGELDSLDRPLYGGRRTFRHLLTELVAVTVGTEELLRPGWRNARHAVEEALAA
jgi:hypothetical protein